VKFIPRRGHESEDQTTLEDEGSSTSRSAKGICDWLIVPVYLGFAKQVQRVRPSRGIRENTTT